MHLHTPQVHVPGYWLANLDGVYRYLHDHVKKGVAHDIGVSSCSRPLRALEYPQREAATRLLIIGGTHGHEPGTVAGVMNLVSLLERGEDLSGEKAAAFLELLRKVHLFVLPVLNPDGRAVCPDSFVGMAVDTCAVYASGLTKDGAILPYDADSDEPCYFLDPKDALFVGGQFNGAGIAINRRRTLDPVDAVEVDSLLRFAMDKDLDAVLDLHACGYNFSFQVRSHEAPYWPVMRNWQKRAETLFAERGSPLHPLHGDGNPPTPPPFFFNSSVFHQRAKLMWIAFEGRQGYLGNPSFMPQPDHRTIIDDYLTAMRVFVELGVEGQYARANAETFRTR